MNKIYVVRSDSGQHDDWVWWIDGIFTNPKDAEDLKQRILLRIEEIKQSKSPIEGCSENDCTSTITDEDYIIWSNWNDLITFAKEDFNGCSVVEYDLNTWTGKEKYE